MKISYIGEISTKDKIGKLFQYQNADLIEKIGSKVNPVLYEFHLSYKNGESIVYRDNEEIINFLEQCKKHDHQIHNQYQEFKIDIIKNPLILKIIPKIENIESKDWFIKFFDIGKPNIKGKSYSCQLQKQSGGRYAQWKCCLCLNWKSCQIYVLSDGVVTYNKSRQKIQQFMHFGKDFSWEVDKNQQYIIIIHSCHRKMTLKATNAHQFFLFLYNLDTFLAQYKKQQMEYRFNSFAPLRQRNHVQFYVDGADYFQALAYGIQNAEQQVFICGWWISPQFSLKRPCDGTNLDYRFDKLLARTAKKGVKIYIVVYYESTFLSNDSTYTIQALEQLDSNIKVLRHPQIVLPTYWSHHEKLVVIDQCVAFLGGLDICYGRYDTQQHLINHNDPKYYPGIEYNNCRRADFVQVSNYKKENVERNIPRLPWHDVALMIKGSSVKDLSRHFIQYWNYSSYQTHYADRYVLVSNCNKIVAKKKTGILQGFKDIANEIKAKIKRNSFQKQVERNEEYEQIQQQKDIGGLKMRKSLGAMLSKILDREKDNENRKKQKQKQNIVINNLQQIGTGVRKQSPSSQLIFTSQKHEQQDRIDENDIQFHISKHHSQQLNPHDLDLHLENVEKRRIQLNQNQLMETFNQIQRIATRVEQQEHIQERAQEDYLKQSLKIFQPAIKQNKNSLEGFTKFKQQLTNKIFGKKIEETDTNENMKANKKMEENEDIIQDGYTCQVLRSSSQWSIGSKGYEKSIYEAYLSLISKAQKFIYIENQFFISATHQNGVVKNKIMDAIYDRVERAVRNDENFKVIVILPLVPGFAGQLDDPSASLPRVIMNWQYKTICRGEQSLLNRINSITKNVQKYIKFLGLRTHGLIKDKPQTQIIYLHSKLIIVDDRYTICGSANINDRSMQGNRDSQLCVLVEGKWDKEIRIEKQCFLVVDKIHQLRCKLWHQHFAISQIDLRNPVDQDVWERISAIAHTNTIIYRQLFGCYPDDQIPNLLAIPLFKKQPSKQDYEDHYLKIKGHVVEFPTNFLIHENLTSYHPNAIST